MRAREDLGTWTLLASLTAAIAACGSDSTPSVDGGARADAATTSSADAASDGAADALATDAGQDVAQAGDGCVSDGDGGCLPPTIRRPFLVGASMRTAVAVDGDGWLARSATAPADGLDEITRAHLASLWLRDALEEHASVAAFARLTLWMMSLGAPPALLVAAQRAGTDEITHARACFAIARRYGEAPKIPSGLRLDGALGEATLADIVRVSAEEGCVGETLGAMLAAEELRVATDADARRVLHKIARDEARHAELAWGFAAWAVRTFGDPARRAVEAGIARAIDGTRAAPVRVYPGVDLAAMHAHGRLSCHEARDVAERAIAAVVLPCAARVIRGADLPATTTTEPAADHTNA